VKISKWEDYKERGVEREGEKACLSKEVKTGMDGWGKRNG